MMRAPTREETTAMNTASASAVRLNEMPRGPASWNVLTRPETASGTSAIAVTRDTSTMARAQ